MKLVFLPEAVDDIERLYMFLLHADPVAAQKAMLAIDEGINLLLDNPRLGLSFESDAEYRELFVPFGKSSYVLRYRLHDPAEELVIVRVWHCREERAQPSSGDVT